MEKGPVSISPQLCKQPLIAPQELPHLSSCSIAPSKPSFTDTHLDIQEKDEKAKEKMKQNADRRAHSKPSDIKVGETVLIRQRKKNKFTTKFDPSTFQVVRVRGTMVRAVRNEKYATRNISQFKKVPSTVGVCPGNLENDNSDEEREMDGPHDDAQGAQQEVSPQECDSPTDRNRPGDDSQLGAPAEQVPDRRNPARDKHSFHRYGQNVYEK